MLQTRPPIVVILGHVDHGKTTLLDFLRQTSIASREAGGITQTIRSFQLTANSRKLTFIDTPGHAAFSAMRSRGSQIADIAVLVVAADDGVMPQTKQSVEYINQAQIPFIVAINKSDLPSANLDKVKTQLTDIGVVVEDFGGPVPCVPISAKTGSGIPDLLEIISLLSELHPPQADPDSPLQAVVLETHLDSQKGLLATVIVKNGTLHLGSQLYSGEPVGKARALTGPDGELLKSALPSQPVEILGLSAVPEVGSILASAPSVPSHPKPSEAPPNTTNDKKFNLILKTDTAGSLEAIASSLPPAVSVLSSGTGDVGESDVEFAKTGSASIFAFNVKVPSSVAKLAEIERIRIYSHKIIYELLDELNQLTKVTVEVFLAQAQIIAEFKIGQDRVAGLRVLEGEISKSHKIRLLRGDSIIGETRIKSLKSGKNDLIVAKSQQEFGAVFSPYLDFKIGDSIIALQ
ncbi:hypothetical protein A2899_04340 [Candidatus Amesbacteria bacterium RIFCSPLOWO2_01_FULL_49_25]|uniref:Tr-type G domain-containing protein n=1 Tax=Candidatus Amesbacteria bacterium RIFCSPHIGHO2_01_FULL_48_32b TaxID=1797253 RepID=A0A1F4YG97_9BACT|nr:MAG: hypothetical protein A2876_00495 [Candidatus Amesbacteria bacterium RIFCSPHIGHO2_01_FULL_48_32b]OGD07502.1 MAG: hypothetical protein A2899_04340 [Candidatus Amesbacteria bacterium RIFCSPLOWO2_01_FULL_49_25]